MMARTPNKKQAGTARPRTPQHPAFDPAEALSHLYTSSVVSRESGKQPVTIRALAKRYKLGTVHANRRYFTAEEVEFIKSIDPRGGRRPDSGRPIEYQTPLSELRRRGPKKDPHRAPADAPDAPPRPAPDVERTTEEVAELLGVQPQRVSRNALNHRIGKIDGRRRVFRNADIDKLRELFNKTGQK